MNRILTETSERIIVHYNKKHNEDTSIPPWVLKFKGKTFYINHFDIEPNIGFSSKETPENGHTKGSLQFKGRLELYEKDSKLIARIF